jgi:hypothetical protein
LLRTFRLILGIDFPRLKAAYLIYSRRVRVNKTFHIS